jgi:hypothetical protein
MSPSNPEDRENEKIMEILSCYGKEFLVFDPDDQPNVFAKGEVRFHPARGGRVNPKQMKNWRHLPRMLQLLRERYKLFTGGRLITECPLFIKEPRESDEAKEFGKAFQVIISKGLVWFRCRRAHFCQRKGCPVKKKPLLDIYDLICWLNGNKDLNQARKVIAEHFDVELANFTKSDTNAEQMNNDDEKTGWLRYAVPKKDLVKLFHLPSPGRGAPQRFAAKAVEVITRAPEVPYDGHNSDTGDAVLFSRNFTWEITLKEFGPASRLFVWLHWKQAEAQRKLVLTHEEIAKALGIPVRTVREYARMLIKGGHIEVCQENKPKNSWSAKYRSES